MHIGIQSAFSAATPPDPIADLGRIVEERGFHSIWVPEHVGTHECIAVVKSLWCDEVSSFQGEFYSLPPCLHNPKPTS